MKTKMLPVMLLAGDSIFAQTQFSVDIGLGGQQRPYLPAAVFSCMRHPAVSGTRRPLGGRLRRFPAPVRQLPVPTLQSLNVSAVGSSRL
jgi:hypothetical protein